MRVLRGYLRTFSQYIHSPKTQFEWYHYFLFLLLFMIALCFLWGGIFLYHVYF